MPPPPPDPNGLPAKPVVVVKIAPLWNNAELDALAISRWAASWKIICPVMSAIEPDVTKKRRAFAPETVATLPEPIDRSVPVFPDNVRVLFAAPAWSIGSAPPLIRSAAISSVGILVIVGEPVVICRTSLIAGVVRVGVQFNAICQSVETDPFQV